MEYGSFQAEEFGDLQRLVDGLFYDRHAIDRLDLIVQAEIVDLAPDLMEMMPVGLEYLGTHQMPLMESSVATRRSTSSMSGPLSVIATGTFSMPKSAVMPKWRS